MSLEAITTKIKEEAEKEAAAIKAEADNRCVEIASETKRQVSELDLDTKAALEKKQAHRESVVNSLEKQRASMAVQSVKRKLIDEVYDEAFSKLLALPKAEYIELLVGKYKAMVPADVKVVSIAAPEQRKEETTEIASRLGWSASVDTDSKLKGGCILTGDNFEFDLSLERLFAEDRLVSEIEVAGTLFSGK